MLIDDISVDTENRQAVCPWFHRNHVKPRRVADEYSSGFRHPPRAAEGNLVSADMSHYPSIGFRVYRLTYRVHQSDSARVMPLDPLFTMAHESSDSRRRSVENIN